MRVAISQPTYLPWIGYLDLIDQVDLFVVLDNVQFAKRSWQQRNRIKTRRGLQWLTVPVVCSGRFDQSIEDVQICEPNFSTEHIRAIEHAYHRSQFFAQYFPELAQRIERNRAGLLVDLNLDLIQWAMGVLGVTSPLVRASSLSVTGKRTELLASICEAVGATHYISPRGSADYLIPEQDLIRSRGIEISFQTYEHPEYFQLSPPFVPFASIIDLIFNEGETARFIMRSGRGDPISIEEFAQSLGPAKTNCVA